MSLRTTGAILCGLAFVALLTLQFLSWATVHTEGGSTEDQSFTYYGFTTTVPGASWPDRTVKATTWNLEVQSGESDSDLGWYSNDLESDDNDDHNAALAMIRVAVPLLLAGLVAFLAAGVVTLLVRGPAGAIVALSATLVTVVGLALFANGVDEVFDGNDYTWVAGFYVVIAACAVGLAASVLGMLSRHEEPRGLPTA